MPTNNQPQDPVKAWMESFDYKFLKDTDGFWKRDGDYGISYNQAAFFYHQQHRAVLEAQTNAFAWAVGIIDEMHIGVHDVTTDQTYKGIKNTLRDRYKVKTGIDPAPSYPIEAQLKVMEGE